MTATTDLPDTATPDATAHSTGQSSAASPGSTVVNIGGTLPVRPTRYVPTNIVKGVGVVVQLTIRTGGCCLIDGPVGVGKTTAVVEAARGIGADAVYVNMFGTSTSRDQMDAIWTAMTGTRGVGTAAQIRDDILDTLNRKQMTLLIDDAHHVGLKGLAPILSIWNRIHTARGVGTPIVLCGNNLERHLSQTLPELLSRAGTRYAAAPLAGKPLVEAVLAMEPAIAGTDAATIKAIDTRYFRGEIRRWAQFFDLMTIFRGGDTTPRPLTDDEVTDLLGMMPRGSQ
ncbi:ATP-binding protein [Nocardioides seonyuensis]|nr:ATP-binding protein [Nocardioides seonyuensis]